MHVHKFRLPVRVHFIGDAQVIHGVVHVRQDQRVIDMLCDQRSFFPVETRDGLLIVGKASVSRVVVFDPAQARQSQDLFPQIDLDALARRSGEARELG